MVMVAAKTARKWAQRYRNESAAGMADRSSRPQHSPTRTPGHLVHRIVRSRWRMRLGPVQIGGRLGLPASTVHAVLTRCRINRLSRIDRVTGEPLRRYEHDHPGSLLHVDVTKFGNIPDGGGHRFVGRAQGDRYRAATPGKPRNPKIGTAFVHTVLDDHSRVAYAEIHAPGPTGLKNGSIERFHRTLADGWAYARSYPSETLPRAALPGWLHFYDHHRPHSSTGGKPPVTRLTNLPGHHT